MMSPEGRRGLWGGRVSAVCHAILAAGPLRGSVLQSDELINPLGITLCCPRQLHQGQILSVLRDALERSSCSFDYCTAPELSVFFC